jgi:hypothetical protein
MTVLGDSTDRTATTTALDNVVYLSTLVGSPSSWIGDGMVVEHSWYETEHAIEIGTDCLVSGLRSISSMGQQQQQQQQAENCIL